ncbi:MAG: methyltransferase domain-containing protein [Gammaproteobacteria bacterium]|nr:methyltransferase domain-containing protein [Gammaproteobacteria bacterium]
MITPINLRELYRRGENISSILRDEEKSLGNTKEIIEVSYDLQAGSYIKSMKDAAFNSFKNDYSTAIANTIRSICSPKSMLEAGVGEATTLSGVLEALNDSEIECYGFDLSWSRIHYAQKWLADKGIGNVDLCTGELSNLPYADNSIDVVYTSHAVEPNGGNEEGIIDELYRVAKEYLILLEPGYEFASQEAKDRMNSHGFCKGINEIAKRKGYQVIKHELFPESYNPLNPTAITIIKKCTNKKSDFVLACPKYKTPLIEKNGMLFSPEALVVYPVIENIPCLRIENGILASSFDA